MQFCLTSKLPIAKKIKITYTLSCKNTSINKRDPTYFRVKKITFLRKPYIRHFKKKWPKLAGYKK